MNTTTIPGKPGETEPQPTHAPKTQPQSPLPPAKMTPAKEKSADAPPTPPESIVYISTSKLRPHPLNKRLYGDELDEAFVANIREQGIQQPLRVTKDYRVISGHRRLEAAIACRIDMIQVIISTLEDEIEIEKELIAANGNNRDRTNEVKIREYRELLRIKKSLAAQRKKAGKVMENLPEGSERGAARDCAAKAVGLSGKTAEHGLKVLEKIEQLEAAGQKDDAKSLRQLLNRSIDGAHKTLRPQKTKRSPNPTPQANPQPKPPADQDSLVPSAASRDTQPPSNGHGAKPQFTGSHDGIVINFDTDVDNGHDLKYPLDRLLSPAGLVLIVGRDQPLAALKETLGDWGLMVSLVIAVLNEDEDYEDPAPCELLLVAVAFDNDREFESNGMAIRLSEKTNITAIATTWLEKEGCSAVHLTSLSELVQHGVPTPQETH